MSKKYNYSKEDITRLTSKFAADDLNILVFRDFVLTTKGKDEVLRVYIEHKPTGKYRPGMYRGPQNEFESFLRQLVSDLRQSV